MHNRAHLLNIQWSVKSIVEKWVAVSVLGRLHDMGWGPWWALE